MRRMSSRISPSISCDVDRPRCHAVPSNTSPANHDAAWKNSHVSNHVKVPHPSTFWSHWPPIKVKSTKKTLNIARAINRSRNVSMARMRRDVQLCENHGKTYMAISPPETTGDITASVLNKLSIHQCRIHRLQLISSCKRRLLRRQKIVHDERRCALKEARSKPASFLDLKVLCILDFRHCLLKVPLFHNVLEINH